MKVTSSALLALSISGLAAMAHADEFIATELKTGASAQSETKGFVEEQTLSGTTRNWYANELKRRDGRFTYNDHGETKTTPAGSTGYRAPSLTTPRGSPRAPSGSAPNSRLTTPLHWIATSMTLPVTTTAP